MILYNYLREREVKTLRGRSRKRQTKKTDFKPIAQFIASVLINLLSSFLYDFIKKHLGI